MANMANFKLPSESGVRHLPRPSGPFSVGWVDVFTAPRGEVTAGLLLRLYYPAPAPAPGSEATPTDGWARWFPLPQYAEEFFNFDIISMNIDNASPQFGALSFQTFQTKYASEPVLGC